MKSVFFLLRIYLQHCAYFLPSWGLRHLRFLHWKKNEKLCQVIFNVEPKKNDNLCLPNHTLRTLYSALQQSYISVQLVYLVEQINSLGILKLIMSKMNHSWKCLWAESVLCFFLINNKSFFFFFYIRDANFRQNSANKETLKLSFLLMFKKIVSQYEGN